MNLAVLAEYAVAWAFLGRVFGESPTAEFLRRVSSGELWTDWPLKSASAEMESGLALMRDFSAGWEELHLAALESDYTRLFVGPATPLAPPWESFYLNRHQLLFQKETLEVREFYRRFELQAPKLHAEPDDHLGLEMAFMSHLCHVSLESPQAGLAAQREFLQAHLLRWAPSCLNLVLAHATQKYYLAAAHLGLGCLIQAGRTFGVDTR